MPYGSIHSIIANKKRAAEATRPCKNYYIDRKNDYQQSQREALPNS